MDTIKRIFLQEARDLQESLDSLLLDIEDNPAASELIEQFMRSVHTYKGSAGTAGLAKLSDLLHEVESVVDLLQHKKTSPSPELFDLLFQTLDIVNLSLTKIKTSDEEPPELISATESLQNWQQTVLANTPREQNETQNEEAAQGFVLGEYDRIRLAAITKMGKKIYRLDLKISDKVESYQDYGFSLIGKLRKLGDVVTTDPAETEFNQLETTKKITALFGSTLEPDEISNILDSPQISAIEINPFVLGDSPNDSGDENAESAQQISANLFFERKVRVDMKVLDDLLRLVGELVISRARFERIAEEFRHEFSDNPTGTSIDDSAGQLGYIANELQSGIMRARMLPISRLFRTMKRQVRDSGRNIDRTIPFISSGENTELDKGVADKFTPTLKKVVDQLVQTAAKTSTDNPAGITAKAVRQGNQIGLLFDCPGSLEHIDVYSSLGEELEASGGNLDITQSSATDIHCKILLPTTQAIAQVMMVRVENETYGFMLESVQETFRLAKRNIDTIEGCWTTNLRDEALSLVFLKEALDLQGDLIKDDSFVVVVKPGNTPIGIVVDRLLGKQDVVIKPLSSRLSIPVLGGSAIMGNGTVALILNAEPLVDNRVNRENKKALPANSVLRTQ
jgi:two-component system chemotaxis sensor kinase CheA